MAKEPETAEADTETRWIKYWKIPPPRRGEISTNVIWGKKYKKQRTRGKMQDKEQESEKKSKKEK
jgi:hypothetical protein